MNTIGIGHNLNRSRIKKLLVIRLFASILTGIGDFPNDREALRKL